MRELRQSMREQFEAICREMCPLCRKHHEGDKQTGPAERTKQWAGWGHDWCGTGRNCSAYLVRRWMDKLGLNDEQG